MVDPGNPELLELRGGKLPHGIPGDKGPPSWLVPVLQRIPAVYPEGGRVVGNGG